MSGMESRGKLSLTIVETALPSAVATRSVRERGMRPILGPVLGLAILLLGLSGASPEPEYSSFFDAYLHTAGGNAALPLIEIESSTGRADRLSMAALQPHELPIETLRPAGFDGVATIDIDAQAAAGMADIDAAATDMQSVPNRPAEPSLADVCNALYASAQDNDLPIAFFANLIWQESRLRDDAVSPKGALGIAQFMPKVAVETGLDNPFDPLQAIPASARLLRELRLEFGNLGFVAAAYNAGARRVAQWLERRRSLPRETRGYVAHVTGLPVEAWRRIAVDDNALTFVRPLPCRSLPAFASVERAQSEQMQLKKRLKLAQQQARLAAAAHDTAERSAQRQHGPRHARRLAHDRHAGKREAAHHPRAGREKHKSA